LAPNLPELSFDYPNPGLVEEIDNGHTVLAKSQTGKFRIDS